MHAIRGPYHHRDSNVTINAYAVCTQWLIHKIGGIKLYIQLLMLSGRYIRVNILSRLPFSIPRDPRTVLTTLERSECREALVIAENRWSTLEVHIATPTGRTPWTKALRRTEEAIFWWWATTVLAVYSCMGTWLVQGVLNSKLTLPFFRIRLWNTFSGEKWSLHHSCQFIVLCSLHVEAVRVTPMCLPPIPFLRPLSS